jgi:hypothetical protein
MQKARSFSLVQSSDFGFDSAPVLSQTYFSSLSMRKIP